MKIPIPALFLLSFLCLYACKTTKKKIPAHYFTHKPQQAKTLVAQYVRCECETRYAKMTPHNWRVLSMIILELYSDSTFILAGNWTDLIGLKATQGQQLVHLSGEYAMDDGKLLLNLQRRQMLSYPNSQPNLESWGGLVRFGELDSAKNIVFYTDKEKNYIRFCGFDGINSIFYPPVDCVELPYYLYLKPVYWLPKPFLLGTQSIDIDFFYDVTIYCRQAFPLKKWDER